MNQQVAPQNLYNTALVIGAGSFGTSIAAVCAQNFKQVIIKVRSKEIYDDIKLGFNSKYLPQHKLPSNIIPALTFEEVPHANIDLIVCGLPAQELGAYFQDYYGIFKRYLDAGIPFVSLSKGISCTTLEMPDDIFLDLFPLNRDLFTFLSGPSFAHEILEKQITIVSLAGKNRKVLNTIVSMLQTDYFRLFPTYDIKGVLLGGALKNILAIACGIIEGLGHNHNTRAALITLGIHDMLRFGLVFNARAETFYGLSGMGDLILTTTGDASRNKRFGIEVGKGKPIEEILKNQKTVIEGYKTTMALEKLAQKYEIKCRLFNGVYRVLYEGMNPADVVNDLLRYSSKIAHNY